MSPNSRRSFLSAVASCAGLAVVPASARQPTPPAGAPVTSFDLSWMDQMQGRHKQVHDFGTHDLSKDGNALRFMRNFIETFKEVYGLEPAQLSGVVGVAGRASAMNMSDRIWAKYTLGERNGILDPATKQPAVRNIFLDGPGNTVTAMQAMGVVFWQCNRALGSIARDLAEATKAPVADVRAELVTGLNPGVRLVPSHVMALALVQERGFTYAKSS